MSSAPFWTQIPWRGGLGPFTRFVLLAAFLSGAARAQTVLWEHLPDLPFNSTSQQIEALAFLQAEGEDASNPALDSLVTFRFVGVFLYNPSGASGAAGDNGMWHPWHVLCENASCTPEDGLVTAANSIVFGGTQRILSRSTNRGRRFLRADTLYLDVLHESALPALAGPDGTPGLLIAGGSEALVFHSAADGAPGTWTRGAKGGGYAEAIGEVPPSAALPTGRLLVGVWNGITGSTDGAASFQRTSLFGQWIARAFAFVPDPAHPYGGVVFASAENTSLYPAPRAEIHRSDDGGATWTFVHRFTPEETGLPATDQAGVPPGYPIGRAALMATPDGVLWAGVHYTQGPTRPGVIVRSTDGGQTWVRADAGFEGFVRRSFYPASTPERPFGWAVRSFELARDGRLYAATDYGVWRTTRPVVAAEAHRRPASGELALAVRPNPSSGGAGVAIMLSAPAGPVRVAIEVTDALGRRVAHADAWATASEAAVPLGLGSLAPGVYTVRAVSASGRATARLTVVR